MQPHKRFFDLLSDEAREVVPVNYRFVKATPPQDAEITRVVESRPYRARGYQCAAFYKPISRCLRRAAGTPADAPAPPHHADHEAAA